MDLENDDLAKQVADVATVRFYGAYSDVPIIRQHLGLLWEIVARAFSAMPEREIVELLEYVLQSQEFPQSQDSLESTRAFALSVARIYGALKRGPQDERESGHPAGEVSPTVRRELEKMDQACPPGWECEFTDEQLGIIFITMRGLLGEYGDAWGKFEAICKRARHIDPIARPVDRVLRD
jgi:hypothetical protein